MIISAKKNLAESLPLFIFITNLTLSQNSSGQFTTFSANVFVENCFDGRNGKFQCDIFLQSSVKTLVA